MSSELLDALCRNSLHLRTEPGPCRQCRDNPRQGVVRLSLAETRRLFEEIDPEHRQCSKCGEQKPRTPDFFYRDSRAPGGLDAQCKNCVNEYSRAWRKKVSRAAGVNNYRRRLLRSYNLTFESFRAMLERQGGRCAICESPEPQGADWAIDHDHRCCPAAKRSCGKCVRGLLCVRCNVGLSYFADDPTRLASAEKYLISQRWEGAI